MSGVGGVPRKLLWTRQERSSRRRAWTIGRRQGRGVTRIGVHVVVKQKWKKEKNDLKAEATAIRREAHARWRGFDDKHNKATATRPQPATTLSPEEGAPTPSSRFPESSAGIDEIFEIPLSRIPSSPATHHGRQEHPSCR